MRFLELGRNKNNFISLVSILKRLARVENKAIDLLKKKAYMGLNKNEFSDLNMYNAYVTFIEYSGIGPSTLCT